MTRKLKHYGKLEFPHYVNFDGNTYTEKQVTTEEWNEKKGMKEQVTRTHKLVQEGTIDIISDPFDLIKVGDTVQPYYAEYEIIEIVEERAAKGEWTSYNVQPIFQKCKIKFIK